MTPELTALTLAALLQVVQFVLLSVPANLELGPTKTASPRDRDRMGGSLEEQLSTKTGRLRALNNHFEGLILFGIACTVITVSGQSTGFTAACAWPTSGRASSTSPPTTSAGRPGARSSGSWASPRQRSYFSRRSSDFIFP
jgi:uncharacterized MAPEG superfamily protein